MTTGAPALQDKTVPQCSSHPIAVRAIPAERLFASRAIKIDLALSSTIPLSLLPAHVPAHRSCRAQVSSNLVLLEQRFTHESRWSRSDLSGAALCRIHFSSPPEPCPASFSRRSKPLARFEHALLGMQPMRRHVPPRRGLFDTTTFNPTEPPGWPQHIPRPCPDDYQICSRVVVILNGS